MMPLHPPSRPLVKVRNEELPPKSTMCTILVGFQIQKQSPSSAVANYPHVVYDCSFELPLHSCTHLYFPSYGNSSW